MPSRPTAQPVPTLATRSLAIRRALTDISVTMTPFHPWRDHMTEAALLIGQLNKALADARVEIAALQHDYVAHGRHCL